jgi:hypothetical protein
VIVFFRDPVGCLFSSVTILRGDSLGFVQTADVPSGTPAAAAVNLSARSMLSSTAGGTVVSSGDGHGDISARWTYNSGT